MSLRCSNYKCYKTAYGTTSYGVSILNNSGFEPLSEEDAINVLKSYIK